MPTNIIYFITILNIIVTILLTMAFALLRQQINHVHNNYHATLKAIMEIKRDIATLFIDSNTLKVLEQKTNRLVKKSDLEFLNSRLSRLGNEVSMLKHNTRNSEPQDDNADTLTMNREVNWAIKAKSVDKLYLKMPLEFKGYFNKNLSLKSKLPLGSEFIDTNDNILYLQDIRCHGVHYGDKDIPFNKIFEKKNKARIHFAFSTVMDAPIEFYLDLELLQTQTNSQGKVRNWLKGFSNVNYLEEAATNEC